MDLHHGDDGFPSSHNLDQSSGSSDIYAVKGGYLVSAVLWLWYGLGKRDKNIYLPCIGRIMLDSAVIVGALVYG